MTILVAGGRGQLGRALSRRGGGDIVALDLPELDLRDPTAITARLVEVSPSLVINAAAYTAVDKAETERVQAFAVNRDGAANLARACESRGIRFLHVSTDYVFDGTAHEPYREDAATNPQTAYGESKEAGERLVLEAGGTVVRTSWLFEQRGPSFVHTIVRLASERPLLRIVADQHGCPTWADDLADALFVLGNVNTSGIFHYCNSGPTTWFTFAEQIVDRLRERRPIACERIEPITTNEYPLPAKRPAYSVLDTSKIRLLGIVPPPWTIGLARVMSEV